jgi:hypothetical protein
MPCYYEDGKRERTKKCAHMPFPSDPSQIVLTPVDLRRLINLSTKTQDYEDLLYELKSRVTDRDARSIELILEKVRIPYHISPLILSDGL